MNVKNGFCIGEASDLLNNRMNVRNGEIKLTQGI